MSHSSTSALAMSSQSSSLSEAKSPSRSIRDGDQDGQESSANMSAKMDDTFYEMLSIHLDQPVNSMSMSPANRDVALGARKGLFIVDLQNPYDPPRFLPYHSLFEVADVQWNPFQSRSEWVVSTCNQKALVYNLSLSPSLSVSPIEHTLHAHTRAVTDINWSAASPEILATCALDGWVWSWDLRTGYGSKSGAGGGRKPVWGVCSWGSGATQVKWNRKEPHIIASSHDNFVLVWDDRMGAEPVTKIEGHSAKIYGIDWSRHEANKIVTCSLDASFKSWNIDAPASPELTVLTSSPVWRARYLPFGRGVLTLPQRTDHALSIWGRDKIMQGNTAQPVARFLGATAGVKEFVWRTRGGEDMSSDDREFQLVTWANDRRLRLWPISEDILKGVGHETGAPITIPVTRRGGLDISYRTFSEAPAAPLAPLAFAPTPRHLATNSAHSSPSLLTTSLPPIASASTHGPSLLTSSLLSAGFVAPPSTHLNINPHGPSARHPPDFLRGVATMTTTSVRNRRQKVHDRLAWMEGVKIEKQGGATLSHPSFALPGIRNGADTGGTTSRVETRASSLHRGTDGGLTVREGEETERDGASVRSKATETVGGNGGGGNGEGKAHTNLGEEITSVVRRFPRVNFEKIHIAGRTVTVSLYAPGFVRATFTFPKNYPYSSPPSIDIERTADMSHQSRAFLLHNIRKLMLTRAQRKMASFESALRFLLGDRTELGGIKMGDEDSGDEDDDEDDRAEALAGLTLGPGALSAELLRNNINTPPPRRGGAVFGPLGQLVVFFPTTNFAHITAEKESAHQDAPAPTPSSARTKFPQRISEAFGNLPIALKGDVTGEEDEYHETDEALQIPGGHSFRSIAIHSRMMTETIVPPTPTFNTVVQVLDTAQLTLTQNPALPALLKLDDSPLATTLAALEAATLRRDLFLAQVWTTLASFFQFSNTIDAEGHRNTDGFMAERVLAELIRYLAHLRDIQTLGLVACLFEVHRRAITTQSDSRETEFEAPTPTRPYTYSTRSSSIDYFSHRTAVPSSATTPYDARTPTATQSSRSHASKSSWTNLTGLFNSSVLSLRTGSPVTPTSPNAPPGSAYWAPSLRSPMRMSTQSDSPDSVRSSMARLGSSRTKPSPSATAVKFGETKVIGKASAGIDEEKKRKKVIVQFPEESETPAASAMPPWWLTARAQLDFELIRLAYASLLDRWGCHHERILVLKLCRSSTLSTAGVANFGATLIKAGSGLNARNALRVVRCCTSCGSHLTGPSCFTCRRRPRPTICSLCQLPLDDLVQSCTLCLHAGHLECYQKWYNSIDTTCPAGCSCSCVKDGGLAGCFLSLPPPPRLPNIVAQPAAIARPRPADRLRASLPYFAI